MAKPKRAQTLQLPTEMCAEIQEISRRTRRSLAYVVARAVGAAPAGLPLTGLGRAACAELPLTTDDDDPADLAARTLKRAGAAPEAFVAAAWTASRARFFAWAEREESAAQAEVAEDLDAALALAASPSTPPGQLSLLAGSEFPRVRGLVARNPSTPELTRALLRQDREPWVRDAAFNPPVVAAPAPTAHT